MSERTDLPPIARIRYLDSCLGPEQESRVLRPVTVWAVGFVIGEDESSITLCSELMHDDYRGQIAIPRVAIELMDGVP